MNYCNKKNCKKAIAKIEHDSQFKPTCCVNPIGPTGPTGPTHTLKSESKEIL